MERGRILILGQSKETTYEIRNLLDNQRFELEIALSKEVGKQVLTNRRMSLIMVHTEMLQEDDPEFFRFLRERAIDVPVFVLGDQIDRLRHVRPAALSEIHYFPKPYISQEVLSCIKAL